MSRTLEIVMKGRNDIGPAVEAAKKDLASIKGAADKVSGVFNLGATVNIAKGAFQGLNAAISLARGDGEAFEEAMGRLPLGLGEAWRSGRELRSTMLDVLDSSTKIALEAKNAAEAYAKASAQNLAITREFKAQSISLDRQIAIARQGEGFARNLETIRQQNAAQRLAITNRAEQGDDISKREAAKLIRQINQLEDLQIASLKRERDERAADENRKRSLDDLRRRREEQDRTRSEDYADWVSSLRPQDVGRGSLGTISTADVTGRFLGLGADAQAEANKRHTEQMRVTKETNEKLDMMLQINERNGGALEQFFGTFAGL